MQVVASLSYTKKKEIGVGQGMNSRVYLANEPQLGGEIVVKEIPIGSFANGATAYFEEAQAVYASRHANVAPVNYAAASASDICIAMPYYPRGSISYRIAKNPLDPSYALRVVMDVLAGLTHIHSAGFVHLDVKPSNVLLDKGGRALVADFGQARSIGTNGVATAARIYWTGWPPESIGGAVTVHADVYQTGLLLYRLVNGDTDWREQESVWKTLDWMQLQTQITNGKVPNRNRFLPHVPDGIRRVVRKALAVDPKDRFQSAAEFADALGRVNLGLNWRCTLQSSSKTRWQADRGPQPQIEVVLEERRGTWHVEVYTSSSGARRAKCRGTLWATFGKRREADQHLRSVFKSLA